MICFSIIKHPLFETITILVIVANKRGAEEAVQFDQISYLGFPFSISETLKVA